MGVEAKLVNIICVYIRQVHTHCGRYSTVIKYDHNYAHVLTNPLSRFKHFKHPLPVYLAPYLKILKILNFRITFGKSTPVSAINLQQFETGLQPGLKLSDFSNECEYLENRAVFLPESSR